MKKIFCKIIFSLVLLSLLLSVFGCNEQISKQKFSKVYFDHFDTVTTVVGYENSKEEFNSVAALVNTRLYEYHKLYDIYNSYSTITNLCDINSAAGKEPLKVDKRIIDMLLYAKEAYEMTGGETNIAMGSILSLWHEKREQGSQDPDNASLPTDQELRAAAAHTDISALQIDENASTVLITDPDMRLDVGAVAKGYATEMIARELESMGKHGYVLNVGGNIRIVGTKPGGEPWRVAVENPGIPGSSYEYVRELSLSSGAMVTSGSYQRYYVVDGKRYHHIIDKDTLYPSEYFLSVSVICDNSALADVLSTALFSMPYEEGIALVSSIDSAEALWVGLHGEIKTTDGFPGK
ncbi:MAG: FAD:protein FMN transferase [Ruminococcaceae bacterium]|nr:FAD:protein FMN transferase [Oscillospiraceae bacterium]